MILILLLSGALLMGQGLYIDAQAWLAQILLARAWDRTLTGDPQVTPWPGSDTWPVARLGFSQPGLSLRVLKGDPGASLAFGPGWAERSAAPGEAGLSVISGHRDTHFRSLEDLQHGEIVTIQTSKGARMSYRVTVTAVAQPVFTDSLQSWQPSERGGSVNVM